MHLSKAVLDQVNIVVITSTPVIQYRNFQMSVESDSGLLSFSFTLLFAPENLHYSSNQSWHWLPTYSSALGSLLVFNNYGISFMTLNQKVLNKYV